ncbi:MAG: FHA domain-containing protein [Gemmataceae bacterium]
MGDPRLNSIHLEPTRREDFRRARDELLLARGKHTLCAETDDRPANASLTCINHRDGPPPDTLRFWLLDREFIYPLKLGLNTLGRSSDNDVIVEDLYASRRHCAIIIHHDAGCTVHDMSSKNGTYLNGARIQGPTALKCGDEIRICNRQFVFLVREPSSDAPPPPSTRTIVS